MKWALLFLSLGACIWGAEEEMPARPRITRKESKELASQITSFMDIESPQIEDALASSFRSKPNYHSIHPERAAGDSDLLKEELMKWALEELAEQHNKKKEEHQGEKKKRIFASIVALITTVASVITPIITYYYTCDDNCSCG